MATFLLENQTSNTSGSQDTLAVQNAINFTNYSTVVAYGTWDGATITLKLSPDDGTTWISCGVDTVFTENGAANMYFNSGGGLLIRGDLTDAGASTSLNLKVF